MVFRQGGAKQIRRIDAWQAVWRDGGHPCSALLGWASDQGTGVDVILPHLVVLGQKDFLETAGTEAGVGIVAFGQGIPLGIAVLLGTIQNFDHVPKGHPKSQRSRSKESLQRQKSGSTKVSQIEEALTSTERSGLRFHSRERSMLYKEAAKDKLKRHTGHRMPGNGSSITSTDLALGLDRVFHDLGHFDGLSHRFLDHLVFVFRPHLARGYFGGKNRRGRIQNADFSGLQVDVLGLQHPASIPKAPMTGNMEGWKPKTVIAASFTPLLW